MSVAATGNQHTEAGGDDDVVGEQAGDIGSRGSSPSQFRCPPGPSAGPSRWVRSGRKQDVIALKKRTQFRREIKFRAESEEVNARIDEIRLAFGLARAQIRHEAARILQIHRGAAEIKPLPRPEAERAAGEIRIVHDGVETGALAAGRIAVAGRVEKRRLVARPVMVVGNFQAAICALMSTGWPASR
jgi:hypothetical protein